MFGRKKVIEKIVLIDLLNDLVREEDIKKRVLEQLAKPIDQQMYRVNNNLNSVGFPGSSGSAGVSGSSGLNWR